MNIEAQQAHDALAANQHKTLRVSSNFDSNKDQLLTDLRLVAADAEKLIKEVASASNEGFTALQARFDAKMVEARSKLGRARVAMADQANQATAAAQTYVKANPWQSAGVLAAVAVILGFCLGRQSVGSELAAPNERHPL